MNNFIVNVLQNTFYAYCCILLSGTRPKRQCTHSYLWRCFATLCATGVETSLLYIALDSPHPTHAVDGHYTRHSSCITLLWLHHNHKMFITCHKNGLASSHQSFGRWFIFF